MVSFYAVCVPITFLDLFNFGHLGFQWRDRNLKGFILICVLKIKQSLMVLEWHEGEYMMRELSFWGEPSL